MPIFWVVIEFNLYSLPQGEEIISGEVQFLHVDDRHLVIMASDNALIRYNSFNIARSECVEFVQPSTSSSVTNLIQQLELEPSRIQGTLIANGSVFLINPVGISFGVYAITDVQSLVISSVNHVSKSLGNIFINGSFNIPGNLIAAGHLIDQGTNLNVEGDVTYDGLISLKGDIHSATGNIRLCGDVLCSEVDHISLNAESGDVSIIGTINGDVEGRNLTVNSSGSFAIDGIAGASQPLTSLTVTAVRIDQKAPIFAIESVSFNGETTLGADITVPNGSVEIIGDIYCCPRKNVVINTGPGAGKIAINGQIVIDPAGGALTFDAGAFGIVSLNGKNND